ncbi:Uncharacterised protein [Mycobacteroides abscessus subsp. abscessus]|nr:Uncharacterised protein [Mycobacteroides abscessus subsp. abscessus]
MTITRPGAHRSTNSGGQGSAPITNAVASRPSGESTPAADGVWLRTVTRSPIKRS